MWIEKVATSVPIGQGEIINNLSDGTGATVNAPSIAAVVEALENKQDAMTFDTVPTASSTRPVTSNGILDYLLDTYFDALFPVGIVIEGTANFDPDDSDVLGLYTWSQVGTTTVSGTVVYYWQRTA